jgi:uncharacterized protein YrrD
MHISIRSMIGKPIILIPQCRMIGWVKGISIDLGKKTVSAVECIEKNPVKLVSSFAWDKNMVPGNHCIIVLGKTRKAPRMTRFLPLALKAVHQTGTGFVTDVIFEAKTGKIVSLEVSDGLMDDIKTGRYFVNHFYLDQERNNIINEVREWKE